MAGFNTTGFIYTCVFLICFVIAYFVILFTNVEKFFKQGAIWPIRLFQIIIALIMAYFLSLGIESLINAFQV